MHEYTCHASFRNTHRLRTRKGDSLVLDIFLSKNASLEICVLGALPSDLEHKYFLRRLFGSGRSSGMGAFQTLRQFSKNSGGKKNAPKTVRGTADLFGKHLLEKRAIVEKATETAQKYGYSEIQTPTIEFTEVFTRSLGTTSDIISKEMFTWKDSRGEISPPENTAVVEHWCRQEGCIIVPICHYGFAIMDQCFEEKDRKKGAWENLLNLV